MTEENLQFRDKAAARLKASFGTWTALFTVAGIIAIWILINKKHGFDPYPFILLNLCLSCLAAVQGIILQISANRGDQVNGQIIDHILKETDEIDELIKQNTELTKLIHQKVDKS